MFYTYRLNEKLNFVFFFRFMDRLHLRASFKDKAKKNQKEKNKQRFWLHFTIFAYTNFREKKITISSPPDRHVPTFNDRFPKSLVLHSFACLFSLSILICFPIAQLSNAFSTFFLSLRPFAFAQAFQMNFYFHPRISCIFDDELEESNEAETEAENRQIKATRNNRK